MRQLYDISYDDYEAAERWVLEGPELTDKEWEVLWEEVRLKAIKLVGNEFTIVYEDMLLNSIIDLLVDEKGFKHIDASHRKHFNLAGYKNKTGLLNDVHKEWMPKGLETE